MAKARSPHDEDTSLTQSPANDVNWAFGTEEGIEAEDYELDDILRGLRISRWFAIAEEGDPFWAC